MSNGYTCCIDINRLIQSRNILNAINTSLNNNSLPNTFTELEEILKNVDFYHNKCLNNYKEKMALLNEELVELKKEVYELEASLTKTIDNYGSSEKLREQDLESIADYYGNSSAKLDMKDLIAKGPGINLSLNAETFKNNMDESVKNFMINNPLTNYPKEYNSLEEWYQSLWNRFSATSANQNVEDLVEKEMAVWRQRQTGSSVTSLATSNIAEEQSTDYREINIAAMPAPTDTNTNQSTNYTAPQNESTITRIPPETPGTGTTTVEQPEVTTSNEINTVPVGLGIAAAGIAGSIGAVIVDSKKPKRSYSSKSDEIYVEEYHPTEAPLDYGDDDDDDGDEDVSDVFNQVAYQAIRDKESMSKFYGIDQNKEDQ